ncbi:hypothetical protein CTZ27_06385 [Streptomyces griseocarneus]|nr:hypothetical protein CTZ27_06385 [Streptomyces griseocarneus]
MNGQRRATAWCGRLLLFCALLLGIVTMHTLGHPTGHGSSHMACPERGAGNCATSPHRPAAAGQHTQADAQAHDTTTAHGENTGMDPMSVCLAVLGAGLLTIVLLLVAAALRRPETARGPAPALLRTLWPIPPPPRHKALARLSVLRV